MSAFGSSAINKSGKKLAPKAPGQRRRPTPQVQPQQQPTPTSTEEVSQRLHSESPSAGGTLQEHESSSTLREANEGQTEAQRASPAAEPQVIEDNDATLLNTTETHGRVAAAEQTQPQSALGDDSTDVRPNKRRRIGRAVANATPPESQENPGQNQSSAHLRSSTTNVVVPPQATNSRSRKVRPVVRKRSDGPALVETSAGKDVSQPELPNSGAVERSRMTLERSSAREREPVASTEAESTSSSLEASVETRVDSQIRTEANTKTAAARKNQLRSQNRKGRSTRSATSDQARQNIDEAVPVDVPHNLELATPSTAAETETTIVADASARIQDASQGPPPEPPNTADANVRKKRKYTKRKDAQAEKTPRPTATRKRKEKRSGIPTATRQLRTRASGREQQQAASETVEEVNETVVEEEAAEANAAPQKKRKQRAQTPEGASDHEIDATETTMMDLCKGSKFGKKSTRGQEMDEIDYAELARVRKEADARAREAVLSAKSLPAENRGRQAPAKEPSAAAVRGPQLKLVNGQMVVDTSSLVLSRPAEDTAGEEQTIDKLTEFRNSHSWLYKDRRDPAERFQSAHKPLSWGGTATDRFYEALRMFGTDFDMISHMFPGKTRRHIKNKFAKEERVDPARIKAALLKETVAIDLEAYSQETGRDISDYRDPMALAEELRELDERERAAIEKQKEDMAEILRQRQEAATAKAAKAAANKAARNKGGPKKPRKKKGAAAAAKASKTVEAGESAVPATVEEGNEPE